MQEVYQALNEANQKLTNTRAKILILRDEETALINQKLLLENLARMNEARLAAEAKAAAENMRPEGVATPKEDAAADPAPKQKRRRTVMARPQESGA